MMNTINHLEERDLINILRRGSHDQLNRWDRAEFGQVVSLGDVNQDGTLDILGLTAPDYNKGSSWHIHINWIKL
ncbi:FG-GAP repeat protein [Anaerolineales bacterium HSG24]|nr:FG-GAP repeat protein [Anaerolineales bacterium HSG24]